MHLIFGWTLTILLSLSGLGYLVLTLVLMIRHCSKVRKPLKAQDRVFQRPISVLIPIKSPAPGLRDVVRALVRQNYEPEIEIVLIFQDRQTAEQEYLEVYQRTLPQNRKFKVVEAPPFVGLNPKNSNLIQGYKYASHDWIYVCDADTRPSPDLLAKGLTCVEAQPNRFATSISVHTETKNLGAHLEAVGINLQMSSYFLIVQLQKGQAVMNGASMLIHRDLISRMGGLEITADTLTDDIVTAKALLKAGGEGFLIPDFGYVSLPSETLGGLWRRFQRWIMIVRFYEPSLYWIAPTSWHWLHLIWVGVLFKVPAALYLSALILGFRIFVVMQFSWMTTRKFSDLVSGLYLPVFELLAPPLWVSCLFKRSIVWAGQKLIISKDGRLFRETAAPVIQENFLDTPLFTKKEI